MELGPVAPGLEECVHIGCRSGLMVPVACCPAGLVAGTVGVLRPNKPVQPQVCGLSLDLRLLRHAGTSASALRAAGVQALHVCQPQPPLISCRRRDLSQVAVGLWLAHRPRHRPGHRPLLPVLRGKCRTHAAPCDATPCVRRRAQPMLPRLPCMQLLLLECGAPCPTPGVVLTCVCMHAPALTQRRAFTLLPRTPACSSRCAPPRACTTAWWRACCARRCRSSTPTPLAACSTASATTRCAGVGVGGWHSAPAPAEALRLLYALLWLLNSMSAMSGRCVEYAFVYAPRAACRLALGTCNGHPPPLGLTAAQPLLLVACLSTPPQGRVDDQLPLALFDVLQTGAMCLGAFVVVSVAVPVILPVFLPLFVAFWWLRQRYVQTSREVKRLEAITRSPVYASFSATLKVRAHSVCWPNGRGAVLVGRCTEWWTLLCLTFSARFDTPCTPLVLTTRHHVLSPCPPLYHVRFLCRACQPSAPMPHSRASMPPSCRRSTSTAPGAQPGMVFVPGTCTSPISVHACACGVCLCGAHSSPSIGTMPALRCKCDAASQAAAPHVTPVTSDSPATPLLQTHSHTPGRPCGRVQVVCVPGHGTLGGVQVGRHRHHHIGRQRLPGHGHARQGESLRIWGRSMRHSR